MLVPNRCFSHVVWATVVLAVPAVASAAPIHIVLLEVAARVHGAFVPDLRVHVELVHGTGEFDLAVVAFAVEAVAVQEVDLLDLHLVAESCCPCSKLRERVAEAHFVAAAQDRCLVDMDLKALQGVLVVLASKQRLTVDGAADCMVWPLMDLELAMKVCLAVIVLALAVATVAGFPGTSVAESVFEAAEAATAAVVPAVAVAGAAGTVAAVEAVVSVLATTSTG